MKKISVYLESSALWSLYYKEEGWDLVEFSIQESNLNTMISHWGLLELERAIQKRMNQKELTGQEAEDLRNFIDTDVKQLVFSSKLALIPVSTDIIEHAKELIPKYNLYSADAVHLATAANQKCAIAFVDDYHFKRLSEEIEADLELKMIPLCKKMDEFTEFLNNE